MLKAAADRRAIRLDIRNLPCGVTGDPPAVKVAATRYA
jgi:hypothetical protein